MGAAVNGHFLSNNCVQTIHESGSDDIDEKADFKLTVYSINNGRTQEDLRYPRTLRAMLKSVQKL